MKEVKDMKSNVLRVWYACSRNDWLIYHLCLYSHNESYLLNMILFLSTMMFDIVLETIHSKF